jgi:hypothetical protein
MGWFSSTAKKETPKETPKESSPKDLAGQGQATPVIPGGLTPGAQAKPQTTDPAKATDPKDVEIAEKKNFEIDPKEKLIRVAATFLTNPKIEGESYELKRTFLKKKGLDDDMIKKAFELYKEKLKIQQEEKELKESIADPNSDTSEVGIARRIEKAKKTKFLSLRNCNQIFVETL